jgi:hypothetical protein
MGSLIHIRGAKLHVQMVEEWLLGQLQFKIQDSSKVVPLGIYNYILAEIHLQTAESLQTVGALQTAEVLQAAGQLWTAEVIRTV